MGSNHEKKMEVKNLETHSLKLVLVTNSEENKLGVLSKIRVTIMIRCENSFFFRTDPILYRIQCHFLNGGSHRPLYKS